MPRSHIIAGSAALLAAIPHGEEYRGGRPLPTPAKPTLSEIFSGNGRDACGVGFALSQARSDAPLLWVQDRMSLLETGRPFAAAINRDFIHVETRDARAALWAMEEGLRCPELGAVVGEIWGNPAALDFTATRRLAVAAEAHGVQAFLILFACLPNLSGARMRWRVESRPSLAHPYDDRAPGAPVWSLDLFRARGAPPGLWEAAGEADRLDLLPALRDQKLPSAEAPRRTA